MYGPVIKLSNCWTASIYHQKLESSVESEKYKLMNAITTIYSNDIMIL